MCRRPSKPAGRGELVNRATQPGATPEDIQRARTFGLLSSGRSGITSLGGGQYLDAEGNVKQTPVSASVVRAAKPAPGFYRSRGGVHSEGRTRPKRAHRQRSAQGPGERVGEG